MLYIPGLWIFIIAAVLIASLLVLTLDKWFLPVGRAFGILMGCALVWVVTYMCELASQTFFFKLLFTKIQFIAIAAIPVAWLYLSIAHTGTRLKKIQWALILLVPTLVNVVVWCVPRPNPFWGNPSIVYEHVPFPQMDYDYGVLFYYVLVPYIYIMLAFSLTIMIHALGKKPRLYRNQLLMLIFGTLIPSIANIFYIFGISPVPYMNISTATFSLTGLLIAWALFRYRFLDLVPAARDLLVENMSDGLLVLDSKHRIIDLNKALTELLGIGSEMIGLHMHELTIHGIGAMLDNLLQNGELKSQIDLSTPSHHMLETTLQPIEKAGKAGRGHIITFHDVTEREALYQQVHELAIRDSLTGVFNHGSLLEKGSRLFLDGLEALMNGVSAIMIDIDFFKSVNDTYGHAAGDRALVLVAQTCSHIARVQDIIGRLGGDEFIIILPQTDIGEASRIATEIRKAVDSTTMEVDGKVVHVTLSLGVASTGNFPDPPPVDQFEHLISLADKALYKAKHQGRNRVVTIG